jgi:hypothetical protein
VRADVRRPARATIATPASVIAHDHQRVDQLIAHGSIILHRIPGGSEHGREVGRPRAAQQLFFYHRANR